MQQYDDTKKKRKITLFVSYTAMTLAVIAISALCMLLLLGYRFNFSTNTVEQGALLQFASFPDGATVILDGATLPFTTSGKQDTSVGPHQVALQRKGYRDWNKTFTVKAGEVRWLNYARLVPTTVETQAVKEFSTLSEAMPSPDRKRIAVIPNAALPELVLVNASDPAKLTYITVPIPETVVVPAGVAHSHEIVEWNLNSNRLLLRHTYGAVVDYLSVNIDKPSEIVNVSSKFGMVFSDIHFADTSILYGVENGNLRRFDLGASSLSEPLVKNVVSMKLYGSSDIGYVRHATGRFEAGVVVDNKSHTVSSYDDTIPLLIDVSLYYKERYMAVTRGASFELIKNPQKTASDGMSKVVTLTFPSELKWLDISSNGRFVIAGSGTQFMTYDIETAGRSDINFPGIAADTAKQPQWIDDYLLVSSADNKLRMSDFDGENQQIVTDCLPGQRVMLSYDGKFLYSFAKNTTSEVSLQASKMTNQ